jgi:TonB-dependent siderophore receptor
MLKNYTVAAISLLLLTSNSAWGEEVKQDLDEVVVTSSRIEEKRKESTSTIDVINEKEMERVKYRNAGEILQRVPGVFTSNFGGEEELTSIRVPTHFTNPYTLVLIDGKPSRTYGSGGVNFREINSLNIERIEVVKGPASALYGSNAIGGVINLITKKPSAQPQVNVWAEAGEYDEYRGGVYGSGTSNLFSYNFDLNMKDRDGWREHSESEKKSASVKLQYLPTDISLLTFTFDYVDFDNNTAGSLDQEDYDADWQQSYHTFSNVIMTKYSPALAYSTELGGGEFSTTFGYRNIDHTVFPGYSFRIITRPPNVGKYSSTYSDITGDDVDLQFLYSKGFERMQSKIVTGVDFQKADHETEIYNLIVTRDPATKKYTSYTVDGLKDSYDITTEAAAPYLQLDGFLAKNFKVQAGGRYDWSKYDVTDKLDGLAGEEGEKTFSQFSPKIGATYDVKPNINLYANYGQGFVVPTSSQLFTSRNANQDLGAEKADNIEIGMRSTLLNNRMSFDIALYHMIIKDKIVDLKIDNRGGRQYRNAAETKQQGIEVTSMYAPVDWGRISFAYTYAENKFEEFIDPKEGVDYSGNWQPRSPKHKLNIRFIVNPTRGLEFELEIDEISQQYADNANMFTYSRPTLLNLRGTYDWKSWSFWAHVNNLADKKYATYVSDGSNAMGQDIMTLYSGSPRTIFAGLSYKWGGKTE